MRLHTSVHTHLAASLAVLVLLACGQAAQPEPETAEPAPEAAPPVAEVDREITAITDNLYRARNVNHVTVFLVTDEGVILTDPINTEFAAWLRDEIADRFGAEVRYVVYSHHHWDHASGGAVFADTATFVAHESMAAALEAALPDNAALLDTDGDGALTREEATGGFANSFDLFDRNGDGTITGAEINADIHPPDTFYEDRLTLTLGGQSVDLVHPGPVHSGDPTVVVFPAERAAFAVDFLNVRRLPGSLAGTTFAQYDAAIGLVQELDIDTVIPGHGQVGTPADLGDYRAMLRDVEAAVTAAVAEGQTLEEMQASIELPAYADWLLFDDRRANLIAGAYSIVTAAP